MMTRSSVSGGNANGNGGGERPFLWKWTVVVPLVTFLGGVAFTWSMVRYNEAKAKQEKPLVNAVADVNTFALPDSYGYAPIRLMRASDLEGDAPPDHYEILRDCVEYISVTISNTGGEDAEAVRLQVGGSGLVKMAASDGGQEVTPFNTEIPLGTLLRGKNVNLAIWRDQSYDPASDSLRIYYKSGQSVVDMVNRRTPLSPTVELWTFTLIIGFFLICAVYLLAVVLAQRSRAKDGDETERTRQLMDRLESDVEQLLKSSHTRTE